MSNFIIGGLTALRLYRRLRKSWGDFNYVKKSRVRTPTKTEIEYLCSSSEIQEVKINVVLDSQSPRRKIKNLKYAYHSGNWKGVIVEPEMADPLYFPPHCLLVSPQFLMLQLASVISFEQLLLVALEFGGTYVLDSQTYDFYQDRQPFLSKKQLSNIAHTARNNRHKNFAKFCKMASYFTGNSASPMESRLYANLSLSTSFGGFGISGLKLNHMIKLSEKATKICRQGEVIVDIYHSPSRTVIEYDSRCFHSSLDQSQKDKRRRDALEFDRYKCFSMTPQQFNDFDSFFACGIAILRLTKGRARIRKKGFEQKAYDLYIDLKRASNILHQL